LTFQAFEPGKVTVPIGKDDLCYGRCEAFGICKIADLLGIQNTLLLSSIVYGNLVALQRQVFKGNIDVDECLAGLDNYLAH
jgi:hypothetical protein